MNIETVPVDIVHHSGLVFRVRLTPSDVERLSTDQDYANEVAEKYYQLHQKGFVTAKNDLTSPSTSSSQQLLAMSPACRNWNNEDEEQLIALVSDRRPLFEHRIPLKERSRDIIRKLWEEIINEMNVDVTVDWISKKWKYIRDSYIRVRGNIKKKISSGSSSQEKLAGEKLMHSHKNYELLSFLDDTLSTRKTTSNLPPDLPIDENSVSLGSPDWETRSGSETPSSSRRAQSVERPLQMSTQDEVFIDAIKSLPIQTQKEVTPTQSFCLRLSDGLEKLPSRIRNQLELEFLTKLTEMENKYLYSE